MRRLVVLLLLMSVSAASSARATSPGTNGRIVFERLRLQDNPVWGELFVANADGTGVHQLTHPPNGTEDALPDWSPDGRRIVFQRQPPKGVFSLWTIGADGRDPRRVTPPCPAGAEIPRCAADDDNPVWSPDGTHIAFQRLSGPLRPKGTTNLNDATAIYKDALVVSDADGSHVRTVVWVGPWRGDPQMPAWSPDGKRLVFLGKYMTSKTNGTGCICRALYVVNIDGTGLRRITPFRLHAGDQPDWSPDGLTILFRTHPGEDLEGTSGRGANLYTVHPDGSGLRQLTHFASYDRVDTGSYAPDGRSIVFEASAGSVGPLTDIFEMNADGSGLRQITKTRNFEAGTDWGPG